MVAVQTPQLELTHLSIKSFKTHLTVMTSEARVTVNIQEPSGLRSKYLFGPSFWRNGLSKIT